ncbi:MAG: phosphatase PAP2 family protein [Candidatus Thermoplasmatota archaeon]
MRYVLIIIGVTILHLIEVSFIDAPITQLVNHDFTQYIISFENEIVYSLSQQAHPIFAYFLVIMYIIVYPFTLWFTPLYFLITDTRKALKLFSYGLALIYLCALPFYLFIPITNVYTYYHSISPLNSAIPGIEHFFYATTTTNNCLPSLHTAMTILLAMSVMLTTNKKLQYFMTFCAICVIIAVIYLGIHWLTDVLTGAIVAFIVSYILKKAIAGEQNDSKSRTH